MRASCPPRHQELPSQVAVPHDLVPADFEPCRALLPIEHDQAPPMPGNAPLPQSTISRSVTDIRTVQGTGSGSLASLRSAGREVRSAENPAPRPAGHPRHHCHPGRRAGEGDQRTPRPRDPRVHAEAVRPRDPGHAGRGGRADRGGGRHQTTRLRERMKATSIVNGTGARESSVTRPMRGGLPRRPCTNPRPRAPPTALARKRHP